MKSINDAFKFELTIEEKDNVYVPVSDKVKPLEWVAFILVVVILFTLAVLPILYERNEKQKETERRAKMYVTLEDDKQYLD